MAISRGRRSRGGGESRPYVFPSLKVDGILHTEDVVIPNTGQDLLAAQQQAAKKIRQIRAAQKTTVPSDEDISPVDPSPAPSPAPAPVAVEQTIREWLAEHLPSSEQLFQAAASLVSLQGIENRVRDLVESFREALDGYRSDFTAWRDGVAAEWAGIVSDAGELLAAWGAKLAELDAFKVDLEKRLFAAIADKVGPKGAIGNTGMAGAAVTVVDRLPKGKGADFMQAYLGRSAVVGDIAIDASTDMRYGWRWDGQSWERGPAMTSIQVRDVRVNAMDASTKVTTTQNIARAGGSGSGGGEKLLTDSATRSSIVTVADTSNWTAAGHENPKSASVFLEVLDTSSGDRGTVQVPIVTGKNPGDTRDTEFALIGTLFEKGTASPDVEVDALNGTVVVPPGLTGVTAPPGASRTTITVKIGANLGSGGPYILSGMVFWNQRSQGRALDLNQPTPQPAWIWG